jgi:hypothetical protein
MANNQPPDLASVLQTLASLAPQAPQQQYPPTNFPQVQARDSYGKPPSPLRGQANVFQPSLGRPQERPVNVPKVIDPATITDWSSGLKCVMKTVARNENIVDDLKRVCVHLHLFLIPARMKFSIALHLW